jgi:hypothetical protein
MFELGIIDGITKTANLNQFLAGQFGPAAARKEVNLIREAADKGHPYAQRAWARIKSGAKKAKSNKDLLNIIHDVQGTADVLKRGETGKSILRNRKLVGGAAALTLAGIAAGMGLHAYNKLKTSKD